MGLYRHVTAGGFPEEYQEKQDKTLRTQNNIRNIKDTSGEPEYNQDKFWLPRILPYKPTFIWNLNSDEYRARFHLVMYSHC